MGLVAIKNIQVGDKVLTHKGRAKAVTGVRQRVHKGLMSRVRYVGWDDPLVCTHDHKVFVLRDDQLCWLPAYSLLPTDSMAFPKTISEETRELSRLVPLPEWRIYASNKIKICSVDACGKEILARGLCDHHYRKLLRIPGVRPEKPVVVNSRYVRLPDTIVIDDEWLYLFGWYVAEGFSSMRNGKGKFISFSGHVKERFILERIQAKIRKVLGVKGTIYGRVDTKGLELRCYSAELAKWFLAWFGHMSENMHLPEELMSLPPRQAAILLRGYTDGDGYQRKKQVEWASRSGVLCYQMCLLAIRSGFIPTMRHVTNIHNDYYVGGYTKFGRQDRLQQQSAEYIFRPIRSVETYSDKVTVYDISVEEDHSFTSGFATVHNCHRIGQVEHVTYIDLVTPGTIDEKILDCLKKKKSLSDMITTSNWKEIF